MKDTVQAKADRLAEVGYEEYLKVKEKVVWIIRKQELI